MLGRYKFEFGSLIESILEPISRHDIKGKTFFDPDIGNGQIVYEIEQLKRRAGCTDEEIANTVYGCVPNMFALNFIKSRYNLVGTYVVHDFENKDVKMKFDYVITNPPYQDTKKKAKNIKLWHTFIKKVMKQNLVPDGYLCAITPESAFMPGAGFGKWFYNQLQSKFSLISVNIHGDVKHFDAGVNTSDWCIQNTPNNHKIDYPQLKDPIIDDIINKILSYPKMMKLIEENSIIPLPAKDKNKNKIIYTGTNKLLVSNKIVGDTYEVPVSMGLKLVISFSASYHGMFITTEPTGKFNRIRLIDCEQEAYNIMSYANSLLYRFHALNYNKTSGFTPSVKNNKLPDLGSDRIWTDDEVFEHFKLTPEEIEYVRNYKAFNKSRKKS